MAKSPTLPVLTSPRLDSPRVRHGFFTRQGGVSQGIYASLNVGVGSKDDPDAVAENRRRVAAHFGQAALVSAYQVHSATALVADGPWPAGPPHADAVVSATPGVVCAALAADCAPILLVDPEARVVAAAHAGWKGALGGIVEATVRRMEGVGASRKWIRAAVGPCIGPQSYEVGLEFRAAFVKLDPAYGRFFSTGRTEDKRMFDLPSFVLARLKAAGVETAHWLGHDTCAEENRFFSNRRALLNSEPDYGRMVSAIMLE